MGIICPYKLWKLSPVLEDIPERTPPQLGTLVHPKRRKSLIYKHSIIILFFQGAQRKAYKYMLMLAAGIEPAKPEQTKKGVQSTPFKLPKFNISAVPAVVEPHARSVTDTQYIIAFFPAFHRLTEPPNFKNGFMEAVALFNA